MPTPHAPGNAIAREDYLAFLEQLDAAMVRARALGLWRTTEAVHRALNEARAEMWEATPRHVPHVRLTVGPVTEQP